MVRAEDRALVMVGQRQWWLALGKWNGYRWRLADGWMLGIQKSLLSCESRLFDYLHAQRRGPFLVGAWLID